MNARRQRTGFSLIELLTVVAIVGTLTALTAGVTQRARDYADTAKCAENLRQLVAANYLYAADHGGSFAPAMDVANRIRWHGKRASASRPFDMTAGYLSPYLLGAGAGTLNSARSYSYDKDNPYESMSKHLECPAYYNYAHSSSSFEKGAGCYGYNMAYIGGQPGDEFTPITTDMLSDPANTIMFADTAFASGSRIQEYPFAEPYYSVNADGSLGGALTASIHFRHNGRANIAWADGHVSLEEPTRLDNKELKIGWIGDSAENGLWRACR